MKALLDTHAFLWWLLNDRRLSRRACDTIADEANDICLSVVSAWELVIKWRLGKLDSLSDFPKEVTNQIDRNRFTVLPVYLAHVLGVYELPAIHKDPFDRMLVAQSRIEGLPVITHDPALGQYGIATIW